MRSGVMPCAACAAVAWAASSCGWYEVAAPGSIPYPVFCIGSYPATDCVGDLPMAVWPAVDSPVR